VFRNVGQKNGRTGVSAQNLLRATQVAQLQEYCGTLLASARMADEKRVLKFGYRVYSQSDEDGIIHEIFRRIGAGNKTFIEIGTGDGLENNSLFLLIQGWRGLWVEGSTRKVAAAKKNVGSLSANGNLRIEESFVTAEDIDDIVRRRTFSSEIDLLSVDIDGNDYYVLQAIRSVSPRMIVAEYNAKFPPDVPWVMEYNKAHRWDGTDYFGASLKALEILLRERGYSLVGCNLLGCNAFFVRSDLVSEPTFCSPFTAENHYEPPRYFLLPAFDPGFSAGFGPFRVVS
jgi:hypothetical protein